MGVGGGLETPLNKSQLPSKLSVSRLFLLVTEDQLVLLTGVLLTVGGLAANAAFFPRLRHPPSPRVFVRVRVRASRPGGFHQ